MRQQRASTVSTEQSARVAVLLQQAQAAAGQPPAGWRRLTSCVLVPDEHRQRMATAKARLEEAREAVRQGLAEARVHFDAVEVWLRRTGGGQNALARLSDERGRLESRAGELERTITEVSGVLSCDTGSVWDRLPGIWQWNRGLFAVDRLVSLRARLSELGMERGSGVLSADLTYVQGRLQPAQLPTQGITPAYQLAGTPGYELEDTTQDREVDLSSEITDKATALGSAKAAQEFVNNELRLDWYYGSLKGATQTLRQKRGNDADLAALLVALLRAQKTPARFVEGTIELPMGKLADLLGLLTEAESQAFYAAAAGGPPFELLDAKNKLVIAALGNTGIPYEPVVSGGLVRAVRLSHIWVEAYLPYGDYRGEGARRDGHQWVPMDPSIPGGPKYVVTEPALDVLAEMNVSAELLTQRYLAEGKGKSPLQFWKEEVTEFLSSRSDGLSYEQVLRQVVQKKQTLSLLPGALPYRVVSVQGEYSFLPENRKHRLHISAWDETGANILEVTLPTHLVAGRRAILTYEPEDSSLIPSDGIYHAPAALVQLRAALRLDGVVRATATGLVGLGVRHRWAVEMLLPDGSKRQVENELIAGNTVALGLGTPFNNAPEPQSPSEKGADGQASTFLAGRAAAYVNEWTKAEEELARLTRVVPVRPTASLVLVENQLQVREAFGVREQVVWKGLEVDADLRSLAPLELVTGRGGALLRLSGYEGSFQEAKVLADKVSVPAATMTAVSAVTLLQEALSRGVPVVRVDSSNLDTALGSVAAPPEVLADVRELVTRRREVLIPATQLTIENWSGTGFIARDPQTEEGGYFLSGRLSGGQTVVSPDRWSDQQLVDWLERPDAPSPTDDLTKVARISKVPSTDLQRGTVGQALPRTLEVVVVTGDNTPVPVRGALVTFRGDQGSNAKFKADLRELAPASSVTVRTDAAGRARVHAFPDTDIGHLYVLASGSPQDERHGLNMVRAEVMGPQGLLQIDEPFWFTAKPGPVKKLSTNLANYRTVYDVGVELGLPMEVTAQDEYDNFIANQSITWTSDSPDARFFVPKAGGGARVQFLGSDLDQTPTRETKSSTLGYSGVGFIPGMTPGPYSVTARTSIPGCTASDASSCTVSRLFTLQTTAGREFIFRVATPDIGISDGARFADIPTPLNAEILRRNSQDNKWTPVTGEEPDIQSATVTMKVLDHSEVVLSSRTVSPHELGATPSTELIDGKDNVVLWPGYDLMDEYQWIDFTAAVKLKVRPPSKTPPPDPIFDTFYTVFYYSGVPKVAFGTPKAAGGVQALDACGQVNPDDRSLYLQISNPATFPLYAKLIPHPDGGMGTMFQVSDSLPKDPADPTRLLVSPKAINHIPLELPVSSVGGKVEVVLYAPDFKGSAASRKEISRTFLPLSRTRGGAKPAEAQLHASIVLSVRNFAAAWSKPQGSEGEPIRVPKTILRPATLPICVNESGTLQVISGGNLVSGAQVTLLSGGALNVQPLPPTDGHEVPVPGGGSAGVLTAVIPPGDPSGQDVVVKFTPVDPLATIPDSTVRLLTSVEDASALPLGHTFVKDVSTVDGHLVKQSVDLEVKGRSPGLQLVRSYTSRGHDASPLGEGWSHSYRSYVLQSWSQEDNVARYMLVGGEGTGQTFDCNPIDDTQCINQEGFHGTFRKEKVTTPGSGTKELLVFRAKDGTEYRYGPVAASEKGPRYPLVSIRSATGNTLELEYGGLETDQEVSRVFEPGRRRFLQFSYERPAGAPRARLARVDLYQNPQSPEHLGVCIAYRYNGQSNLSAVQRYDSQCPDTPGAFAALREESFTYVNSSEEDLRNNLESWTDANGHTTTYVYYAADASLPGESDYLEFGRKQERIRFVKEPEGATTEFIYSLTRSDVTIFGVPIKAFVTEVRGPRPDVTQGTRYYMDLYGTAVHVERPLSEGVMATTSSVWSPVHMRRTAEKDARGRETAFSYDARGNLIMRRISLAALSAPPEQGGNTQTVRLASPNADPNAIEQEVGEYVEKWSYDPSFNQPVCTMDAEGRITTLTLHPGTGLVLESRRYAQPVSRSDRSGTMSCEELASLLPTSSADIVQKRAYCGVAGGSCPQNAITGDLVATWTEGELNRNDIKSYDLWGLPSVQEATVGSGSPPIVTTLVRDSHGMVERQEDTFGHVTTWEYDGLDRVVRTERLNDKVADATRLPTASPSMTQTFSYYPGGQLQSETNGIAGFERHYTLDGLNRVKEVREKGGLLTGELVTEYGYDETGNRTRVTDRRGVTTTTRYDWGDRPIETSVQVLDGGGVYASQGGVNPSGPQVTATFGYDAVGNKFYETDLYGRRTEYVFNSLYRRVERKSPTVPGARFGDGVVSYVTTSRYDLVGNLTKTTDGNEHATWMFHDFANRLELTWDAAGRAEHRQYDHNGNLLVLKRSSGGSVSNGSVSGGSVHLTQTTEYDGLNRPLFVRERYQHPDENGSLSSRERSTQTHYADAQNAVTVKDARGFLNTTVKDDADRVIRVVVDAAAGSLSGPLTRDPDDRTLGSALSLTTLHGYDGNGNLATEVDPLGRKTTHSFDGLNRRLETHTPMQGVEESFSYDGEGSVIAHVDARGVRNEFSFDMLRRPVTHWLVESLTKGGARLALLTRTYGETLDRLASVREVDARGNPTTRYSDALQREIRVVDAKGKEQATRYDAVNVREQRDRKNYVTRKEYDEVNRLVGQQDLLTTGEVKYSQSIAYDDAHQSETHTDRRLIPLKKQMDGLGRVVRTIRGTAAPFQTEETVYNAGNLVVEGIDANKHRKEWRYDGAGRKVSETLGAGSALAATTAYQYDAVGNLVERKGPRTRNIAFDEHNSFDSLNRLVRREDALGNVWLTAYDAVGNKVCENRPLGSPPALSDTQIAGMSLTELQDQVCGGTQVTRYEYDELGKLTSVKDANGGLHTFVYDAARNLVAKQDARQNLTTYEYDELNLRQAEHQHLDEHARLGIGSRDSVPGVEDGVTAEGEKRTLTWKRTYDPNENPDTETDSKGQVTTSVHGILDRLESRTFAVPLGAPRELPYLEEQGFEYDPNGNLRFVHETKQTQSGQVVETTTRTYDNLDRLKTQSRTYGEDSRVVEYEYDDKGNRSQVTDPDGVVTTYTYDALDRLETAVFASRTTTYHYWPDGLLKSIDYPNGVMEGRCYDNAGRLEIQLTAKGSVSEDCTHGSTATLVHRSAYGYDKNGNRTSLRELRASGPEELTEYGYDKLDRLAGTRTPEGKAILYRLDAVGNREGEREALSSDVDSLGAEAYAALSSDKRLRDLTSTFNRADWLRIITDEKDATRSITFDYDFNGNLVLKKKGESRRTFAWDVRNTLTAVFDSGTEVGRYDYDVNLQRVSRKTASEQVSYVLDDDFVLQELDAAQPSQSAKRRYHYAKGPLAVSELAGSTSTKLLHTDAQGSVTDVTSDVGAVSTTRKYDAWGNYRGETAPSATDFKLGYTGHQYDLETGLTYARARYYDSDLGRFISRDSYEGQLADAPSLHRYAYAQGNPLRYRDESGHSATAIGATTGFFWGFGQMATAMGRDLINGRARDTTDYLSLWGQNIIGGAEIGASIDLVIASGGTLALAGAGALGGAGTNALTFDGEAKSWSEFVAGQKHGAAWGAAGGVVLGKAAPLLAKVPIVKEAVVKVGEAGTRLISRYVASAGDEIVTAAPNLFKEMGFGFGDDLGMTVAQSVQQGVAEVVNGGAVTAPEISAGEYLSTTVNGELHVTEELQESFRQEVRDRAEYMVKILSNQERGPVLSGVLDVRTKEVFFGINQDGVPSSLHPILRQRLEEYLARTGGQTPAKAGVPGAHSEIVALSKALHAREAAFGRPVTADDLAEFLIHNRSLRGTTKVNGIPPPCDNCSAILPSATTVLGGQ
ncbi:hypothetical protein BON30_19675 [Cystobacter ferrugineus]|uniref:Uncharacterized protein n=1 Tax=Cystobacter ferrugineus TaxID=83449 RepID=A0A1L9BBQ4_9BACT|nr:hypothetical protein BON30_19675 [Cystobacter ferrugineus]